MVLGKLDGNVQKNETRPLPYTINKNKFKITKDLNMRPETIKILEENTGSNLFDLAYSNFFFFFFLMFIYFRQRERDRA